MGAGQTGSKYPALSRQPTRLAELVRGTAELVTRTLRQQVRLDIAAMPGEETLLALADPNQLQQALVNLALNARDAAAIKRWHGRPARVSASP